MRLYWLIWLLPLWLLPACGPARPGRVEFHVTDHQRAIDQFERFEVTISALEIHRAAAAAGGGWVSLPLVTQTVDLTQYAEGLDGPSALVAAGTPEEGQYDGFRVTVDEAGGVLKEGGEVTASIFLLPIRVDFPVKPGRTTIVVFDLVVLDASDENGGYLLVNEGVKVR